MKLEIRLFAGLADTIGKPAVSLTIEEESITGGRLKQLLAEAYPDAGSLIRSSFLAKNQTYADDLETLTANDEIALIPPVSGGLPSGENGNAAEREPEQACLGLHCITRGGLIVEETAAKVADDEHGASLLFVGTTRRTTFGKRTELLEYEAYVPMALKTMSQIGDEIASRWPGTQCAITHRIGIVPVGETSVVIAVSTPHRADCYEASRYAIERLKQIVPIWKKEVWEDGSEWKGHQTGPWNPLLENPPAP